MSEKEKDEKASPVRKAKTGAWWKSVPQAEVVPDTPTGTENPFYPESQEFKETPADPEAPAATEIPAVPESPAVTETPAVSEAEAVSIEPEPPVTPLVEQVPDEPAAIVAVIADSSVEAEKEKPAAIPRSPRKPRERKGKVTGVLVIEEAVEIPPTVREEAPVDENDVVAEPLTESAPPKKRRSRRGGKKRSKQTDSSQSMDEETETAAAEVDADLEDDEETDRVVDEGPVVPDKVVTYKLLINAEEPEECRIALVEDGRLESFHVTTIDREPTKNNIYKGRIVSVEANLQAAFVDIGTGRNGFLPFNEIHPEYYRQDVNERNRNLIAQQQWKKLKIEEVMQKGQEVLVQVVKEVTGNKGANMTTFLSLPGRCLVLMPGSDSAGISRKIVGDERRAKSTRDHERVRDTRGHRIYH
jgi:ribonuclease E